MRLPRTRWALFGAAGLSAIAIAVIWAAKDRRGAEQPAHAPTTPGWVHAPDAEKGGAGAENADAARADPPSAEALIGVWRNAIMQRDADAVVRLDRAFRDDPDRYLSALVESAQSDPNERVRAFSTRVLGKLVQPALAPTFGRLLADQSPYVRQNAAWALGELGGAPEGRAAARSSLATLKRARSRDHAGDVRAAARTAAARLE